MPIAFKTSVEICSFLRYRPVKKAKAILEQVILKKQAIPFKKFRTETPHRRGKMAEGRYPLAASKEILKLLKSVESSALHQGLSSQLIIQEMKANKGPLQWHAGRQRRTRHKRTHVLIRVGEEQKDTQKVHNKENQGFSSSRNRRFEKNPTEAL